MCWWWSGVWCGVVWVAGVVWCGPEMVESDVESITDQWSVPAVGAVKGYTMVHSYGDDNETGAGKSEDDSWLKQTDMGKTSLPDGTGSYKQTHVEVYTDGVNFVVESVADQWSIPADPNRSLYGGKAYTVVHSFGDDNLTGFIQAVDSQNRKIWLDSTEKEWYAVEGGGYEDADGALYEESVVGELIEKIVTDYREDDSYLHQVDMGKTKTRLS